MKSPPMTRRVPFSVAAESRLLRSSAPAESASRVVLGGRYREARVTLPVAFVRMETDTALEEAGRVVSGRTAR